jgi:phosphatidylethanolamine/phosphatidyl-N-methylethanolamine N-methyltransferase|tara:strand:+ start:1041 stop:1598 length:558 start_codon:yes stop_codon:yes gene_type:complete
MEKRDFFKEFFKNKKLVGSMRPSSPALTEKMLSPIDFSKVKTIVELGPGTGVFTRQILERMAPDAQLLVFELHDQFYHNLKSTIHDERCHIVHDSAEKLSDYLEHYNLHKADVVISSLPLANFSKDLRGNIVSAAKDALTKDGIMTQFQYSLQSKKYLKSEFGKVKINYAFWNFPPAFIYTCQKG